MKHLCIIAAAILLACCQAKAGSETMNMTEGDTLYTWNLQEHIKDQPISVPRGGDTPDIVTLLTAFNHAYPTGDLSYLLGLANDPKFTRSEENEYGGYDVIDRKNGYAGTDITSGADGSYMDAALWRRNDGHRLLILHFGQPTDPEIDFVLCYDYDPKTQQLSLDKKEAEALQPLWPSNKQFFSLPQQGKDIHVREWSGKWWQDLQNTYTWDGQYHHFGYTDHECLEGFLNDGELKTDWGLMWENYENPTLAEFALVDLDSDDNPELLLCEATEAEQHLFQALFTNVDGRIEQIGISDRSHEMTLLVGGCRTSGNADVGLGLRVMDHAVEHVFLENSRAALNLMCYILVNDAHDGYNYEYSRNRIEISEATYDHILESVREWTEPIVWRKVK